jgi:hypothetical protein
MQESFEPSHLEFVLRFERSSRSATRTLFMVVNDAIKLIGIDDTGLISPNVPIGDPCDTSPDFKLQSLLSESTFRETSVSDNKLNGIHDNLHNTVLIRVKR